MVTDHGEHHVARVLIVDDHELIREQVASRVAAHRSLLLVGTATSAEAAVVCARNLHPDVVVIDGHLFESADGLLCRQIREMDPDIRCIVYTATNLDEDKVLAAGASAVVLKQLRNDTLLDVLRATVA